MRGKKTKRIGHSRAGHGSRLRAGDFIISPAFPARYVEKETIETGNL